MTARTSSMLISRPTRFGNQSIQLDHQVGYRNFTDNGLPIFGDRTYYSNKLGTEALLSLWNSLALAGLKLNIDVNVLAKSITFTDDNGMAKPLDDLPYHPIRDADLVNRYRRYFAFYMQMIGRQYVRTSKHGYSRRQAAIKNRAANIKSFPKSERIPIHAVRQYDIPEETSHVIDKVLGREVAADQEVRST
jgi:hypothetical protein